MAALQVRDFPDELYDELRECSTREFRSIAQQTTYIIEEYLRAYRLKMLDDSADSLPVRFVCATPSYPEMLSERERKERREREEVERQARIEKRRKLLEKIDKMPQTKVPDDFPDAAELIRQGREERTDRILATLGESW